MLSGTPIQNSVVELWALFDFLMPGFLGEEAAFNATYGQALSQARASKRGSAQAQAGLLAMDRLHKQVCPCTQQPAISKSSGDLAEPGYGCSSFENSLVCNTRTLTIICSCKSSVSCMRLF